MIYTVFDSDSKTGKGAKWFKTDNPAKLLQFAQYALDSFSDLNNFYVAGEEENEKAKFVSFNHLFIDVYGMRKRNFDERMKNVFTGNEKAKKYI